MEILFADYFKRNPKVMIGVLLATIAGAGLSGGIYIDHLHSSLEEQKNEYESRLAGSEERLRLSSDEFKQKLDMARAAVDEMEAETRLMRDGVAGIDSRIVEIRRSAIEIKKGGKLDGATIQRFDQALDGLGTSAAAVQAAASTAQVISQVFYRTEYAKAAPAPVPAFNDEFGAGLRLWIFGLVGLATLLGGLIILAVLNRRHRLEQTRNE